MRSTAAVVATTTDAASAVRLGLQRDAVTAAVVVASPPTTTFEIARRASLPRAASGKAIIPAAVAAAADAAIHGAIRARRCRAATASFDGRRHARPL